MSTTRDQELRAKLAAMRLELATPKDVSPTEFYRPRRMAPALTDLAAMESGATLAETLALALSPGIARRPGARAATRMAGAALALWLTRRR